MNSAKENRGCDRHLLGLMLISKELGLDMPKIFKDTAWKKRYFLKYLFIPEDPAFSTGGRLCIGSANRRSQNKF
jgi:hypothetical protein